MKGIISQTLDLLKGYRVVDCQRAELNVNTLVRLAKAGKKAVRIKRKILHYRMRANLTEREILRLERLECRLEDLRCPFEKTIYIYEGDDDETDSDV